MALELELSCDQDGFETAKDVQFRARFENSGAESLTLTFWWNGRVEVRDAQGAVVAPGPGPVLPCGIPETPTVIQPGASFERTQGLFCTQPGGLSAEVGWGYELPPGDYKARLLFGYPPSHGLLGGAADHWEGSVTSDDVAFRIEGKPQKPGLFARLFGGS